MPKPKKRRREEENEVLHLSWEERPPMQSGQCRRRDKSPESQGRSLERLLRALRTSSTTNAEQADQNAEEIRVSRDPYGDVHPVFRDRTPPVETWFRRANEACDAARAAGDKKSEGEWSPSRVKEYERLNRLYKRLREGTVTIDDEEKGSEEGVSSKPLDGLEMDWRDMFRDEEEGETGVVVDGRTEEEEKKEGNTEGVDSSSSGGWFPPPFCREDVPYVTNFPSETHTTGWRESERRRLRHGFELERLRLRALLHVPRVWRSLESSLSLDAVNAEKQSVKLRTKVSEIARAYVQMAQVDLWAVGDPALTSSKERYQEALRHLSPFVSESLGFSVAGKRASGILLDAQNEFLARLVPHLPSETLAYLDSYTGGYMRHDAALPPPDNDGASRPNINTCEKIMDMAKEWPRRFRDEKPFLEKQTARAARHVWRYKLALAMTEEGIPEVDFSEAEAAGTSTPPFCRQWNFGEPCYTQQLMELAASSDPWDDAGSHPKCPGAHLCLHCSGSHRVVRCPDVSNRCSIESLIAEEEEKDGEDKEPLEHRIDSLRIQPVELPRVDLLAPGRILRRMREGGKPLENFRAEEEEDVDEGFSESDAVSMMPWGIMEDE